MTVCRKCWTPQPLWPWSLGGVAQSLAITGKRVNRNDNARALCFGLCEPLLATAADKLFQSSFRPPCAPILAFCTFQKSPLSVEPKDPKNTVKYSQGRHTHPPPKPTNPETWTEIQAKLGNSPSPRVWVYNKFTFTMQSAEQEARRRKEAWKTFWCASQQ